MVLLRGSPRGLGVLFRVILRATGLHFLLRHFPLLLFLTLAIIPLSWAWANFVTPSVWFTKKVLVETECGPVQGFTQEKVSYFLGVPYAMPPLRELRWRSPRPAKRWRKPYDASYFRAECQQGKLHNIDRPKVLSEDCLFLNIWAPSTATWKKPVPVMVWLYGGAFQQGGTSKVEYYGENMAAKGVVLVSCNYRLGALGFLVSSEDGLYGNYGLQDQRFCLEWVQRNIRGFGGDPNSVTLFGESAGAMAVGQHLLMSGAGRLFHRVIMQSNPFSYHYRSLTIANFLGQAVKRGIDCHDLRCMQEEPVDELLDVQDTLHGMPRSVGDFFTWGPVVREGPWRNAAEWTARMEVPITVQQPLRVLEAPNFVNTVPVILGTCKDEGHMFVYNVFPFPLPKYLYWAFVGLLFRDSAPKVIRYYWDMAEKQCRANATAKADYRPVLSSILNDYMFRCPSWRAAHLLQEKSRPGVPVYVYQFAHPTRVPGYPECQGLSCHTAELPYVFNNLEIISKAYALKNEAQNISAIRKAFNDLFFDVLFKVNRDERLASLMSDYWTSFGKTADPNFKGAKVRWPQWKGRRRYHLQQNPVDDAYSETGRRGRKGGKAVATREGGGGKGGGKVQQQQQHQQEPHYLELKWPPEVHLATRDCTCDFWDKIGYKY